MFVSVAVPCLFCDLVRVGSNVISASVAELSPSRFSLSRSTL